MKPFTIFMTALASLICFAYFICFLLVLPSLAFAGEQTPLPRLHVEGNSLKTTEGKPVTLRGVSLCSLSWHNPLHLLQRVSGREMAWNANVVRLPVQPEEWEKAGPEAYFKTRLDPAVNICRQRGLYCIIDWHEIADWNTEDTARKLEHFWQEAAPRYKDEPHILYEIFNEPIAPKTKNRRTWLAFRDKMQPWVDMVRYHAPDTVLLVGSPHWSQMPSFAAKDPLRGENLVYVGHFYGNYEPKSWDKEFGNASEDIPLFLTEWGWSSLLRNRTSPFWGTLTGYAEPLKQYLTDRPQINWTAWSYDPQCGPAMLGTDREMGEFVYNWLADLKTHKP